jgi:hypothetical protein
MAAVWELAPNNKWTVSFFNWICVKWCCWGKEVNARGVLIGFGERIYSQVVLVTDSSLTTHT